MVIDYLKIYTFLSKEEIEELEENLLFIRKLELGIKTGKYDPKHIVDLLILGILGGDKV